MLVRLGWFVPPCRKLVVPDRPEDVVMVAAQVVVGAYVAPNQHSVRACGDAMRAQAEVHIAVGLSFESPAHQPDCTAGTVLIHKLAHLLPSHAQVRAGAAA